MMSCLKWCGVVLSFVSLTANADDASIKNPETELVLQIVCDVAPSIGAGDSPLGKKAIVPILGGHFWGNEIKGVVLPGGADRQQYRNDGFKQLEATYELKTDDGAIIGVKNHVLAPIDRPNGYVPYSNIELSAPNGKYAWVNQNIYIGTLTSLRPEKQAVLIRVYKIKQASVETANSN